MPFSTYLPEHMGFATLEPSGPFVAGSYQELILTYTAGTFGIDGRQPAGSVIHRLTADSCHPAPWTLIGTWARNDPSRILR